jgi:hypothetical protein
MKQQTQEAIEKHQMDIVTLELYLQNRKRIWTH